MFEVRSYICFNEIYVAHKYMQYIYMGQYISARFARRLPGVGWIISVFIWLFYPIQYPAKVGRHYVNIATWKYFGRILVSNYMPLSYNTMWYNTIIKYCAIGRMVKNYPSWSGLAKHSYGKCYSTWPESHPFLISHIWTQIEFYTR